MSELYGAAHRELQEQFDTSRLVDRLEETVVHDFLTTEEQAFIAARGFVSCSYRGGEPGFVRAVDQHTIVFPNYDGNGMYLSMGNVLDAREVGILFIDFGDPLKNEFPEAQFVVRVKARAIIVNCPRYVHKMLVGERSPRTTRHAIPTVKFCESHIYRLCAQIDHGEWRTIAR